MKINPLDKLASSYKSKEDEVKDPLGREAFLTMLVTQLQHQDPLNPMDGTDFTAQLAQFSQLEATFNTNKLLEGMLSLLEKDSSKELEFFIGKEVLAELDSIEVSKGEAVGGFYTLDEAGSVTVNIYDEKGSLVRSLFLGQQAAGSYPVSWDGRDGFDNKLSDGAYRYDVIASGEYGMKRVQTTIEGRVDGILYADGRAYLEVNGTFVDPASLIKVWEKKSSEPILSPTEFIGRDIKAESSLIDFEGSITGKKPVYTLDRDDEVIVRIYNSEGKLVDTLYEGVKNKGEANEIDWDGRDSKGNTLGPGVYSYDVMTKGAVAYTGIQGEVTGLVYRNGVPYLNLDGYLVSVSSVQSVE